MSSVWLPAPPPLTSFFVGQKAVVWNTRQQILLLRRSGLVPRAGGWDLPGGALEAEDPLEGVRREVLEETGLTLVNIRAVRALVLPKQAGEHSTVLIGYTAACESETVILSPEHDAFAWLKPEEAVLKDLPEPHRVFVREALSVSQ